jgi:hypothetical protein
MQDVLSGQCPLMVSNVCLECSRDGKFETRVYLEGENTYFVHGIHCIRM